MNGGHDDGNKLVTKVRSILENCNFEVVDSNVHFDFDKDGESDFETDVCAIYNGYLISIECKTTKLNSPKRDIVAVRTQLQKILTSKDKNVVYSSDLKKLTNKKLAKIKQFRHGYAFFKNFNEEERLRKILLNEGMLLWDYDTIQYYDKIAKILGDFTRNEILHDFKINIGSGLHKEPAIEIEQGKNTMYVLGMHPGLLLDMGYVFRRAKKDAAAYQRIINPDRLEKLSKFLRAKNLLLANSVIIAFDKEVSEQVQYNHSKKEITFPTSYCSAWIIDGQHRIFAFKDSKYSHWTESNNEEFKLPVVAFKNISETQQNRTFVNINYYQKRIDPILFCDLAASVKDLKYELTWSSLLAKSLNEDGPWRGMIKTSEVQQAKPISIAAFARNVLLTKLLGYKPEGNTYDGPLYKYAKFNPSKSFESKENQIAFGKQLDLLNRFFGAIKKHTEHKKLEKNKWINAKKYGLTKATCVNAMLLVLKSMLEEIPKMNINMDDYLLPVKYMNFTNKSLLKYGRGFPAYQPIANELIEKINNHKKSHFKKF